MRSRVVFSIEEPSKDWRLVPSVAKEGNSLTIVCLRLYLDTENLLDVVKLYQRLKSPKMYEKRPGMAHC